MAAQEDQSDAYFQNIVRRLATCPDATRLTAERFQRILRKARQLIGAEETAQNLKSKRHTLQNTQQRLRVIAHDPNEQSDPDRFRDTDEYYEQLERADASMSAVRK